MNLVRYYAAKVLAVLRTELLIARRAERPEAGVVVIPGSVRSGPVLFDFSNPALVHLGDQLFHVPLAEHLAARGIEVFVDTPSLKQTFAAVGAKVGAPGTPPLLVLSKKDAAPECTSRFPESTFLGIHYGLLKTEEQIALAIARITLAELRKLGVGAGSTSEVPYQMDLRVAQPEQPTWLAKVRALEPGKGLIAWNGYLGSGHFAGQRRKGELEEKVRELRGAGYRIVHLGSAGEKSADRASYPFVDLDLRGEIPPDEAVPFMALPEVVGVLSFDTFLTHAATVANKKIWVVMRRKGNAQQFRQRFVPFVPGKEHLLVWFV